jgi:hypothetical protein
MTHTRIDDLVRSIHAADARLVLAITGGGSRAIAELLEVPGGSRTLLEAIVPYSSESLVEWLGAKPERFCDVRAARAMAMAGFERGRRLLAHRGAAGSETAPIGVGCTASLVSDRPKRGPHRAHVAAQTTDATWTWSLELAKHQRGRHDEEGLVAALILNAIAQSTAVDARLSMPLRPDERVAATRTDARDGWRGLLLGTAHMAGGNAAHDRVVFPGAFNPLHRGHRGMADLARQRFGMPVAFEISIVNVDKPPLDYTEMATRAQQFGPDEPLRFTRAPTFVEKARLFPGAAFVVGVDTMARLAEPRYYQNDPTSRDAALAEIASQGCRFLVFGRKTDGGFLALSDLSLPQTLRAICQEVPAAAFREDISSTALRRAADTDGEP